MDKKYLKYVENLNHDDVNIRLGSLEELKKAIDRGEIERPVSGNDVNNHIHTTYSFSPYSPAKAIWMAYNAGLTTAGIMDHDSISGAREFIQAGKIVGLTTTIGVECRVHFSGTPLKGRRINNPDQKSVAYIALHGIPHTQIDRVKDFFKPYLEERNKRNKMMVEKINEIMAPFNISVDFENDIKPLSKHDEGGSITERHILFALSKKLVERFEKGQALTDFLKNDLKISISPKVEAYLADSNNPFYEYDLLGALKSDMVAMFYIDADKECPDVKEAIKLSEEIGAISAYAYLGDVVDSVTGDKKAQKFEDDYIEELFDVIKELGFNAVTYMPSRNTMEQLRRVKALCEKHELFQISGEDINSPRQSFVCVAMRNEEFKNLIDSTWALIGHEKIATKDINKGMFSRETLRKYPSLEERIKIFKKFGRNGCHD
ncbi:MAG TPA: PHP domain-containing protein [Clostridiaceae bacterium]|nr:PHP domain-containing protein [Clostridiaceae bacterium]